jgi:hypothetical protein
MFTVVKIMCISERTTKAGESRYVVYWVDHSEGKKRKGKTFKDLDVAKAFEKEKLEEVENRRKRKLTDRIEANAVKRQKGLETYGESSATEAKAIRFLAKYISNLVPVTDGAHADLVKISNLCKRMGWGIQIKSTAKRDKLGVAGFSYVNKYPDLVVICVLLSEEKVWIFHGRELTHLKRDLGIGKTSSKYNQHEVALENLDQRLTTMLEEYEQHDVEYFNRQLSPTQLNEFLTHRRWVAQTKAIVKLKKLGDLENGVVDCIELRGGELELNIQEKVAHPRGNGFFAPLRKNSGRHNGKSRTYQPYGEGDCDVYRVFINTYDGEWDHGKYKSKIESGKTIGWFEFTERELIARGYISTNETIGKQGIMCYLPEDVCLEVGFPLPKQKSKSLWTRECFTRI